MNNTTSLTLTTSFDVFQILDYFTLERCWEIEPEGYLFDWLHDGCDYWAELLDDNDLIQALRTGEVTFDDVDMNLTSSFDTRAAIRDVISQQQFNTIKRHEAAAAVVYYYMKKFEETYGADVHFINVFEVIEGVEACKIDLDLIPERLQLLHTTDVEFFKQLEEFDTFTDWFDWFEVFEFLTTYKNTPETLYKYHHELHTIWSDFQDDTYHNTPDALQNALETFQNIIEHDLINEQIKYESFLY